MIADSTMNITKVYETATTLIGEHSLENGKTMGLSAYGKDNFFEDLFYNGLPNTNLFLHKNGDDQQPILKKYIYNQTDKVTNENYQLYADYSYQVQKQTQNIVLNLVKKFVAKTGITNICFSGGYALNVVTNEFLIKNLPNVNFYFEPLADDSGNSIGSAMFIYRNETKDKKIYPLKHTFFNNIKHNINVKGKNTDEKTIAQFLNQEKIVAVFNEQAEAGPRSLGNRSILFSSTNKFAKDIVNQVKNREWYRPFACSILKEYVNEYFEMLNLKSSPFMTISFQSKTNKIPGVIHVDNSCRIQTVDDDIPHLYKLLKEFYNITKIPVLLNTSFNLSGYPLVETPEDAINTFNNSKIDVLWFPEKNIMLTK
jgi:carbamoyltransferase